MHTTSSLIFKNWCTLLFRVIKPADYIVFDQISCQLCLCTCGTFFFFNEIQIFEQVHMFICRFACTFVCTHILAPRQRYLPLLERPFDGIVCMVNGKMLFLFY